MKGKKRTLQAIVLGFAVGLFIGPISVFAINARYWLRSNEDWPEWSQKYLLALLVASIPAAVNGAIGAGVASRRGSLVIWPISILPVILHLAVGICSLMAEPQSFTGFQLYTMVFTVIIWAAGRLGQRIGCAFANTGKSEEVKIVESAS